MDAQLVELEGTELHDARAALAAEQMPLQLHGRILAVGSTLYTVLGHKVRVRSLQPSTSVVAINRSTTKIKCLSASLAAVSPTIQAIDWQQRLTLPLPSSILGIVSEALGAFISPPHAPASLLVHGAPGTGKTSAAVAIASALTLPSHFIASASLLRSCTS